MEHLASGALLYYIALRAAVAMKACCIHQVQKIFLSYCICTSVIAAVYTRIIIAVNLYSDVLRASGYFFLFELIQIGLASIILPA